MLIEDMRGEAPMCTERLPCHHASHTKIPLCHVAHMITLRIHDNVSVRLLEAHQYVHHLDLSRDNQRGVGQQGGGWMALVEYAIWIFGNVHGG